MVTKNSNKICVIGSGVTGLSCAKLLLDEGHEVTLFTAEDPRTETMSPEFSSLFPAASIIPHSVSSDELSRIFLDSKRYFQTLYNNNFPGVGKNIHFELFTQHKSLPEYADLMDAFQNWDNIKHDFYPRHPEIEIVSGWRFQCFFTDWGLYYEALLDEVLELGVHLVIKKIAPSEIRELPFESIINCAGLGVVSLFEEPGTLIHRGHLIQISGAPLLTTPDGQSISYNFTPGADIYQTRNGILQDVYCYPRQDGWVLGGSRQPGQVDDKGNWEGDSHTLPTENINGLEVPGQITKLNQEIIRHSFGINTDAFPIKKAKLGYRYVRSNKNGLRIEAEEVGDKLVIHNYGHGGSGVTLSWGSALKALQILNQNM